MSIRKRIKLFLRYRRIARVFAKHGLDYLLVNFGLDKLIPFYNRRKLKQCQIEAKSDNYLARKLRDALTELGPTFVKFGQMLSTRPDIFSPIFIEELEKLQDRVQAFPYEEVVQQIEKQLGHPDEIFAKFYHKPLAAASIGQVHLAYLKSGEKVILKIQRPYIKEQVENDLEILIGLAEFAEKRSKQAKMMGLATVFKEYAKIIRRELDYDREAKNTERIYNNFIDNDKIITPKLYWEFTTPQVLTQEYIEGVKLSDLEEITARNWDRRKISKLCTEAFLTQVMIHGFFTADPHPGNILVINDEKIAFIDFGAVGSVSDRRLKELGEILIAVEKRDMDQLMSTLIDMEIISEEDDIENLQEDIQDLMEIVLSSNIGKIDIAKIRSEVLEIAFRYRLRIPHYLTSLMKALITVEGVGKKLDPSFQIEEIAKPMSQKVIKEKLKPENIYKYARRKYYRDFKQLGGLPWHFNKLIKNTGDGNLQVKINIDLSKNTQKILTHLLSRLSVSLIIAGGLVGSAMIITSSRPNLIEDYLLFGVAGFSIALLSLIFFVISALGSRK